MKVYIASDFHLKFSENKESIKRTTKVIEFLESIKKDADILVLNGDIFDLWYAWNNVIIKGYFSILRKIAEIRESGCRVIFIAGNHDFWFRNFLKSELDIEIYRDFCEEEIDGKKLFITHGDRYTNNDLRYKIFRLLVRSKFVMKIFGFIHPEIGLKIGKLMSRTSRNKKMKASTRKKREAGLIDFAKKKLTECDIVLMGHSHTPKILKFENGIYANSGDWITNNSYLTIIDGKIELNRY